MLDARNLEGVLDALRNNYSCDIDKAVSSSDFCDLLLTAFEVMQYFAGELLYTNTPAQPLTQCLSAPSDGDRSLISSIVCGVCANPSCVCPCTHNHIIPGYNFAPVSYTHLTLPTILRV